MIHWNKYIIKLTLYLRTTLQEQCDGYLFSSLNVDNVPRKSQERVFTPRRKLQLVNNNYLVPFSQRLNVTMFANFRRK